MASLSISMEPITDCSASMLWWAALFLIQPHLMMPCYPSHSCTLTFSVPVTCGCSFTGTSKLPNARIGSLNWIFFLSISRPCLLLVGGGNFLGGYGAEQLSALSGLHFDHDGLTLQASGGFLRRLQKLLRPLFLMRPLQLQIVQVLSRSHPAPAFWAG